MTLQAERNVVTFPFRNVVPKRPGGQMSTTISQTVYRSTLPAPPIEPSVAATALRHAAGDPTALAVVDGASGEGLTRAELAARSAALGAGLRADRALEPAVDRRRVGARALERAAARGDRLRTPRADGVRGDAFYRRRRRSVGGRRRGRGSDANRRASADAGERPRPGISRRAGRTRPLAGRPRGPRSGFSRRGGRTRPLGRRPLRRARPRPARPRGAALLERNRRPAKGDPPHPWQHR